jgi:hypothetical protein
VEPVSCRSTLRGHQHATLLVINSPRDAIPMCCAVARSLDFSARSASVFSQCSPPVSLANSACSPHCLLTVPSARVPDRPPLPCNQFRRQCHKHACRTSSPNAHECRGSRLRIHRGPSHSWTPMLPYLYHRPSGAQERGDKQRQQTPYIRSTARPIDIGSPSRQFLLHRSRCQLCYSSSRGGSTFASGYAS